MRGKTQSECGVMGNPVRAVLICWRRLNTKKKEKCNNDIFKRSFLFYLELSIHPSIQEILFWEFNDCDMNEQWLISGYGGEGRGSNSLGH